MTISLRDYQEQCLKAVQDEYRGGVNRQLIVLPTGSGKTIVMAAIAKAYDKKVLVLAHREELVDQAVEKFKLLFPASSIGVCMGGRNEIDAQVVVGSVQSCSRPKRIEGLHAQGFGLLMVDESHHAVADSYQKIIKELGFGPGSEKLLVGVTATPSRSDNQGLDETFEKIVFSRSIGTMIRAGYLSPVHGRKILTNLTLALERVRIQNGDFAVSDLAEAVNTPERNAFIVEKFQEYAWNRKAVAFCVNVQHCQDLAQAFNDAGIAAAAVWGDMDTYERKETLADLKAGKIKVATSCGVLTEGFDEPTIDSIVMCRPTRSPGLYIQCVGRGLRLWPGKPDCLVLDFTDRGHNLDSAINLSSAIPEAIRFESQEESSEEASEVDRTAKIDVIHECDKEFDILGRTRFVWVPTGGEEWSLLDDDKREIVLSPCAGGYIATLYSPNESPRKIVENPLPLEYCSGVAEDYSRRNLKISFANPNAAWMSRTSPPTDAQREYLEKNDVDTEGMSKADAAIEIRKVIAIKNKQWRLNSNEPLTEMQKLFLDRRGINTKNMTKLQAMQRIGEIKQSSNHH
jgi:ATP-dependent helicase IRC3